METFLSSSSPLFTYHPCKACNASEGFSTGESYFSSDGNGTDTGMVTIASIPVIVKLNFTGVSLDFVLSRPQPQTNTYTTKIKINSTDPPSYALTNGSSISNLPLGRHEVQLVITKNDATSTSTEDWVRFDGVRGGLGTLQTATSGNVTIDDSAWRDWTVLLTPGWNMLEKNSSNWINNTQFNSESLTSWRDWNSSISWTEQAGAGNTILFKGSAVWVYGHAGQEAGSYEVMVDNLTQGVFNASGGSRVYNQVLYHTSNLPDTNHTLSLRNIEQGKRLSFDHLTALSNLLPGVTAPSMPPMSSPPTSNNASSAAADSSPPMGIAMTGTIIGVTVAVGVIMLALGAWGAFAWRSRRRQMKTGTDGRRGDDSGNPKTFWRWSTAQPRIRPFVPLMDPKSTGPEMTSFKTPRPLYEIKPFFHFPSPTSVNGSSWRISAPNQTKPAPKPKSSHSFFQFSSKNSKSIIGSNGKETTYGGKIISAPTLVPPPAEERLNYENDNENIDGFLENRPMTLSTLRQPTMSPALVAAISGHTSPLSEFQKNHQTNPRFPDMVTASSAPKGEDNEWTNPNTLRQKAAAAFAGTPPPPLPPHQRGGFEQEANRPDSFGILSAYDRESHLDTSFAVSGGTGWALGSPSDIDFHRLTATNVNQAPGVSIIPMMEERSPRRRFFGKSAEARSSAGSTTLGELSASGWDDD